MKLILVYLLIVAIIYFIKKIIQNKAFTKNNQNSTKNNSNIIDVDYEELE